MAEESCLDLAVVVMTDSTIICYDTTALRCAIFDKVESTRTVIVRTNLKFVHFIASEYCITGNIIKTDLLKQLVRE